MNKCHRTNIFHNLITVLFLLIFGNVKYCTCQERDVFGYQQATSGGSVQPQQFLQDQRFQIQSQDAPSSLDEETRFFLSRNYQTTPSSVRFNTQPTISPEARLQQQFQQEIADRPLREQQLLSIGLRLPNGQLSAVRPSLPNYNYLNNQVLKAEDSYSNSNNQLLHAYYNLLKNYQTDAKKPLPNSIDSLYKLSVPATTELSLNQIFPTGIPSVQQSTQPNENSNNFETSTPVQVTSTSGIDLYAYYKSLLERNGHHGSILQRSINQPLKNENSYFNLGPNYNKVLSQNVFNQKNSDFLYKNPAQYSGYSDSVTPVNNINFDSVYSTSAPQKIQNVKILQDANNYLPSRFSDYNVNSFVTNNDTIQNLGLSSTLGNNYNTNTQYEQYGYSNPYLSGLNYNNNNNNQTSDYNSLINNIYNNNYNNLMNNNNEDINGTINNLLPFFFPNTNLSNSAIFIKMPTNHSDTEFSNGIRNDISDPEFPDDSFKRKGRFPEVRSSLVYRTPLGKRASMSKKESEPSENQEESPIFSFQDGKTPLKLLMSLFNLQRNRKVSPIVRLLRLVRNR